MFEKQIRVLVVDDHPIVLKGLTAAIDFQPDMNVIACATTGPQALSLYRETMPDVTIMDVTLKKEMTGIETTATIRQEFPDARIIVLSVHQEEDVIYRALRAGASSYLLKETLVDDLVRTIREIHAGRGLIPREVGRKLADWQEHKSLTARELEVLRLVAEGLRNKEIAAHLAISKQTVQSHIKNVFAKLGVNERTKAVRVALQRGMIDTPS